MMEDTNIALSEVEAFLWDFRSLSDEECYIIMNMAFDMHRTFKESFIIELNLAYQMYKAMPERRKTAKQFTK